MYKKLHLIITIAICLLILSSCGQLKNSEKTNSPAHTSSIFENKNEESSSISETSDYSAKTTYKNPQASYSENTTTNQSQKHVVTFKDYDGTILKTENVDTGKAATPPINASKDGFKIVKWDKSFENVNDDIIVSPVYEKISGPTISIDNIKSKAGDTVEIPVRIQYNPGIIGASIKVTFDSNLKLGKVRNGETLKKLNFTEPGVLSNPCTFLWDGIDENINGNGEILYLSFIVSEDVKQGEKLGVSISYKSGDIYNKDLDNVDFDAVGGSVTIE